MKLQTLMLLMILGTCHLVMGVTVRRGDVLRIVLPDPSQAAHRYAASQLRHYLEQSLGVTCSVSAMSQTGERLSVYLGDSSQAHVVFPELGERRYDPDEVMLRSRGSHVFIGGDSPRGVLYGVYEFLERYVGIRFLTPDAEHVPKRDTLILPDMDYHYAPQIKQREVYFRGVYVNGIFAAKMRCNGPSNHLVTDEYGGHHKHLFGPHSFGRIIPEREFGKHPDYFSEIQGRRVGKGTQLCLTNVAMRKVFIERVLAELRRHPEVKVINLSENDNRSYCSCASCREMNSRLGGGHSSMLIWFLNQIAAAVSSEFPDVTIETYAYLSNLTAPSIVPAKSIRVMLCPIDADCRYGMDESANAIYGKEFLAWSQKTHHLAYWDYLVNFKQYLAPFPNLRSLTRNIRFFTGLGVTSAFLQGDVNSRFGDFMELKTWLAAKLLWNPSLDARKLCHEFIGLYYGEASELVEDYLASVEGYAFESNVKMDCYQRDWTWLPAGELVRWLDRFKTQVEAVRDKSLKLRLERIRFQIRMMLLMSNSLSIYNADTSEYRELVSRINIRNEFEKLKDECERLDIGRYTESKKGAKELLADIHQRLYGIDSKSGKKPFSQRDLSAGDYVEISPRNFGIYCGAVLADDGEAAFGCVASVAIPLYKWAIQIMLPEDPTATEYDVYVFMRCSDARASLQTHGAQLGVYNMVESKDTSRKFTLKQLVSDGYQAMKLGRFRLNRKSYAYVAPLAEGNSSQFLVERVVLVRVPKGKE